MGEDSAANRIPMVGERSHISERIPPSPELPVLLVFLCGHHERRFGTAGPVVCYSAPMDPVAVALARMSKTRARYKNSPQADAAWRSCVRTCAKELEALSESHASSSVWASAGIATLVWLCEYPDVAAAAATALIHLSIFWHLSRLSEQEHAATGPPSLRRAPFQCLWSCWGTPTGPSRRQEKRRRPCCTTWRKTPKDGPPSSRRALFHR